MSLISFTNICVDYLSYGKKYTNQSFVYFLTHLHKGYPYLIIKIIVKASLTLGI